MTYVPSPSRYDTLNYRRSGRSGLLLPSVSLGLWHNFGGVDAHQAAREMTLRAFDLGITHFDLANNYGPPPGSAEVTFGRVMREDLTPFRDELVISTKAGYLMWPGPYGEWGSRKYLVASIDQSLQRMGLDYVDIFYSHRPDPKTPLEETMGALDFIVRSGRALYAGISSYDPEQTRRAAEILSELGTPCLIHQPKYNMFDRWIEDDLLQTLEELGIGCICFSPLAQGLLTDKYLNGIPAGSRAAKETGFLRASEITENRVERARKLQTVARQREQSLAQMAISWVLRHPAMTSALIGASRVSHIEDAVAASDRHNFTDDELSEIEQILSAD